jgi:ABC-type uncharacterized transport system fused permease/ATPase subunit
MFPLHTFFCRLELRWREHMTSRLLDKYFTSKAFYRLRSQNLIDNPDQRINDDVAQFCSTSIGLAQSVLTSVLDLVSFAGILVSIYPPLFVALFAYAAGGTYVTFRIGRSLADINFQQERSEADFRYSLVRVRENAESIAFYRGQERERLISGARLERAVETINNKILVNRNLGAFQSFYQLFVQFAPAALVAPKYFNGSIEFGVITQSSSAFNHILNDVSFFINKYEELASFTAIVDRLGQFNAELDRAVKQESATPSIRISLNSEAKRSALPALTVQNLSLHFPMNGAGSSDLEADSDSVSSMSPTLLLRDLNWSVNPGEAWLIMGESGAGKTTLLRSLACMWDSGSGDVEINMSASEYMFVPQRPYLSLGTLREQLLYPRFRHAGTESLKEGNGARLEPSDEWLIDMLQAVRLPRLAELSQLDVSTDWSQQLSLGEQQRISFARILLAEPSFALFDESTSALDVQAEREMYRLLRQKRITLVSIGHRPTLVGMHDKVLRMHGPKSGGRWDTMDANEVDITSMLSNDGVGISSSPAATV